MNLAKLRQYENALTTQQRKVYDLLPTEGAIGVHAIIQSLPGRPDFAQVEGICHALEDKGLARSFGSKGGGFTYRRVQVEEKKVELSIAKTPPVSPSSPLFAQLRMRINEAVNALTEIETLCAQAEAESAKVQKLKDVLSLLQE